MYSCKWTTSILIYWIVAIIISCDVFCQLEQPEDFSCYSCMTPLKRSFKFTPEYSALNSLFQQRFINFLEKIAPQFKNRSCSALGINNITEETLSAKCLTNEGCYELRAITEEGKLFLLRGCAEKFLAPKDFKLLGDNLGCHQTQLSNSNITECLCKDPLCNAASETVEFLKVPSSINKATFHTTTNYPLLSIIGVMIAHRYMVQ